jgi:Transposase DDE domain
MSRRLRTTEVHCLMNALEQRLRQENSGIWIHWIDGKPLTVGTYSKDTDAKWGKVGRGFARGYKIHALYGTARLPDAWETTGLNVSEPEVALRLLPLAKGGGYLLGDKAFDSNPLHEAANRHGYQLVTERKRPGTELGHRRHSPGRLRSMELLRNDFGRALLRERGDVERAFGWLTNHSCGLAPLPSWVRRPHRVRQWVQAKLISHVIYTKLNDNPRPLARA